MNNKLVRRFASLALSLAMLMSMTPTAFGTDDASANTSNRLRTTAVKNYGDTSDHDNTGDPGYAPGQAVVLFEDNTVDTKAPTGIKARRAARNAPKASSFGRSASSEGAQAVAETENTLGQQAEILDKSIRGHYVIEDTVVMDSEDVGSEKVISLISSDSLTTEALVRKLKTNKDIRIAEPNYIYHATAMPDWNDTYLNEARQLTGENSIHADAVWQSPAYTQAQSSSDPVVVAVLDTGIDYYQPDLKKHIWTKPKSKAFSVFKGLHGYDFIYNTTDPMDENGHGTHCAGIIAGAGNNGSGIVGVSGDSDKVQLLAVRVLDEEGAGTLEGIVSGIKYIIRLRKAGANIRLINCSLGAPYTSDIFDTILNEAGEAGILTIAAAGNEATDSDVSPSSPANSKSDYVISVGAADEFGNFASYSNYGKKNVDIIAPGSNILSTVSYENFAPYLYNTDTMRATTEYYGEFGGAEIVQAVNAQGEEVDTVKPVSGTDYNGDAVTDVGEFGNAVLLTNRASGSTGKSSLELTDDRGFAIGNNQTSLRWKITDARIGDTYILYFPYDKVSGDTEQTCMNLAFRPHTDEEDGGAGYLDVGDVRINGIDKHNKADWDTLITDGEGYYQLDIDPTWNSIWQASGSTSVFFPYSRIKSCMTGMLHAKGAGDNSDPADSGTDNDTDEQLVSAGYGLGMVYQAVDDGDIYIDISSVAISRPFFEIDEEHSFGNYDVYSGTSMATPVVTGSAALMALMNPKMSVSDLKSTIFASVRDGYDGWCSTGGFLDFACYTPAATESKPSIGSISADFSRKTVTLKGRGFGLSPLVTVHNNVTDRTEKIPGNDIKTSGGNIVISNAGARTGASDKANHGIIGSDITFTVENTDNGKKGQGTFYVVKGLKKYDDGYDFEVLQDESYEGYRNGAGKSDEEIPDGGEGFPEDPGIIGETTLPDGMMYLSGANDLYLYNSSGAIYSVTKNDDLDTYVSMQVGTPVADGVREYVQNMLDEEKSSGGKKKTDNLWLPDNRRQETTLDHYTLSVLGNPAYMGGSVYELVHADLGYRDAYLLMGMRLDDPEGKWRVFYDSLAGLGSAPDSLDFTGIHDLTLAGYKGKLYILGAVLDLESDPLEETPDDGQNDGEESDEDEIYEFTADDILSDIYSCAPIKEGAVWEKESAKMPAPRAAGYAVAQGGSLYYALSLKSYNDVDYTVYKFNGSRWTTAGTLPKALFLSEKGTQVIDYGFFQFIFSEYMGVPCGVGIDSKGILFGGMSFDGAGDTFRFNTTINKVEPLGYSLWNETADRATEGMSVGNKFWVQYKNDSEERIVAKTMPINTGYVRLARTIEGDGTGIVTGGEYCPKGEGTDVTIVPDDGCYIYSVSSTGTKPVLNYGEIEKNIAKTVKARQKTIKTVFPAKANGTLDVVFGRISTSITAPKSMTKAVGRRDLGICTDGTISEVNLKSGNKKYAKVNKDGTVTFMKAGLGKTVKITVTAKDNPSLKTAVKVKIVSRKVKKFKLGKYKVTFKTKVLIDRPLGKSFKPRSLKAKAASKGKKVKLTWKKGKKTKGLKGYIILRKTGKGRYVQIARVKKGKLSYVDKTAKKGKTYRYAVVAYKKSGKFLRVSRTATPVKIKLSKK